MPDTCHVQASQEWIAIQHAKGFGCKFSTWALAKCDLDIWYLFDPPVDWLQNLYDSFQLHVDALTRDERRVRCNLFKMSVNVDLLHFGGSFAHAIVKPPTPPCPVTFAVDHEFQAVRVRQSQKGPPQVRVPRCDEFEANLPLKCLGEEVFVQDIGKDDLLVVDHLPPGHQSSPSCRLSLLMARMPLLMFFSPFGRHTG